MSKFALALLLFLPACVSFPPPDANQRACAPGPGETDPSSVSRPSGDVVAKMVRFTDDGEYVRRCELTDLFYELQAGGPQIVVVYVHGWKHNGEESDADRQKFSAQLAEIRKLELNRPTPRRVVGVYVAWNGKRTSLPLAKELTFWGRKRAADRVSQSAAVTRLLGAIDSIRTKRGRQGDLTVYVGHSFGARMLYNAVAQVLIHRTELAHPGGNGGTYGIVQGVGDIVILLNPAFEASLFTTFDSVRRHEYPFQATQPPVLVSISSKTDRATRIAFPLGQVISLNHSAKRRATLGNYAKFWTHELAPNPSSSATTSPGQSVEQICSPHACLTSLPRDGAAFVPFLNVSADPQVMDGHNDVWNPKLVGFIAQLISQAGSRDQRTDRVPEN